MLSFPFTTDEENARYGSADGADVASVRLANALDRPRPFLRRSLLPGLHQAAHRNLSRGLTDLDLFEIGLVFLPEPGAPTVRPTCRSVTPGRATRRSRR